MNFPLDFWSISLWLAITSVILVTASEMLSQYHSKLNIRIDKKRLHNAALIISILFLVTAAIEIITVIVNT